MMWFSQEGDNPKPDDDAYIAAFYDDLDKDGDDCPTTLAASTSAAASQIRDFIEQEEQEQSPGSQTFPSVPHDDFTSALSPITRLAIVTSGSVPTPLDTDSVNYLDTLGSGNRAAACAEEFLKRGYHVVFLYREGSLRPFSRVLAKRMKKAHMLTDQVQLNSATGRLELVLDAEEEARMAQTLKTYETVKPRLLEVAFSDLFEYLYLLREACRAAAPLGHGALLFLAAGLSKMFIPRHDLSRPSAAYLDQGKESLKLSPVPHVIRAARQSWCSQAFLVAFKLENDTLSLVEGAHRLLERHGLHLVIGNTVRERNRRVLIITERDEIKLVSPHEKELEPSMVKAVVRNHKQFALEREALKSSRSLLGLSAKFTMLRENKSVVDEDAYGKKQVPFKVGLKIKADRRKADSPIYQLKAVYTNKGGSARANLWQRVIAEEEDEEVEEGGKGGKGGREGENSRGSSETSTATSTAATASPVATTTTKGKGELLLTFSPAGNPETILSLWGDTYKGWLEEEVKRILAAAKHIPFTTYLKILAAPLTADFTDLADLLAQLRSSIASAWEKREKTQFINSLNNLSSLAFDRALTPLEGLLDAQELLDRRRVMELLEEEEGGRAGSMSSSSTSPSLSVRFGRTPSGAFAFAGGGGGGGEGGEVKAVKLHKPVFRGLSLGSMLQQNKQRFSRRRSTLTATGGGGGGGEGGSRLSQSRYGVPVVEVEKEEEALVAKAGTVRVHNTVKRFAEEMLAEGVLDDVLAHLESNPECRLVVTGYSLGGMLSQIFCLRLGEALLQRGMSTRQVLMIGFGSPRVGDEGFKARLRLLYPKQSALMNVVYPLDTLHAFPPAAEGYADAVVKVFLRQPGQFVGRRAPSRAFTSFATPLTWLRVFDSKVDEIASKHRDEERARAASESAHGGTGSSTSTSTTTKKEECGFCGSDAHTTLRHRCRTCTERGSHRSSDCPNKDLGCKLCGLPDHPTGKHLCSVCKLHGHRGRYCHELASVGWAELAAFAIFHDASYYSFATAAEDPAAVQRMAEVPLTPPRASRPHEGGSKVLGVTFKEEDMEQLEVVNQLMLSRTVTGLRAPGKAGAFVARRHISYSQARLAKILLSDATDKVCAEQFRARGHEVDSKPGLSKEELKQIIGQYDALVVRSATKVTKDLLSAATNLKVVGRAGTGVDNIDTPAATMQGVLVVNTPGGNTISTAELTFTHMLALSRNIPQAVASLKAGKWERNKYTGTELTGKTLAVIGLGRIGREVARWGRAFGMTTIGFDPIVSAAAARAAGIEPFPLEEVWAKADFITLHTPLTKDTRHLISAETLKKCKKGVRIVNCARGGIIDEAALLEALESGHVAGASLDVYESEPPTEKERPLVMHPRVVSTPHLGANTKDAQVRVAKDIAIQLSDILEQKDFVGVVNAPNIDFARKSQLIPYLQLAEKVGSLQAQLIGTGKIKRINVTMQGKDVAVSEMSESIKIAVLKGTLSHLLDQEVNFLNAGPLATDMGLSVNSVLVERQDTQFSNTIKVEFEMDGFLNFSRSITGTVFGGSQLRIIEIDGFKTDIPPTGSVVFFNNLDRPGALKAIAGVLSQNNCNISHFSLGRQTKEGKALGAITLDEPVPRSVLEEIGKLPEISNCSQVQLLDMPDKVFRIHQKSAPTYVAGDARPHVRPENPQFSSGPTKKRPGYSYAALGTDCLGRSHRSKIGKAKLKLAIEESKRLLQLPDDYRLGIVPASDTGAYEMAMWSMLGERPVDIFYWESFGKGWFTDAVSHLGLKESVGVHEHSADYGELPDFTKYNPKHDALFTYNGTTSGARLKDTDWIPDDREGLTFNDATSAAFAMPMAWPKLDVTTYSWQKVLGGEGGHGVIILSPRAVERLESYKPKWPLPKIFRMTKKGKLDEALFEGSTINTPSMLAVEDYLDALAWADTVGGLEGLVGRSVKNYKVLEKFVSENKWISFLVKDPSIRSTTSVCLQLDLSKEQVKAFTGLLEKEGVGLDMGSYRDAPPGLRIWCGATVDSEDLEALMPWLSWAYAEVTRK